FASLSATTVPFLSLHSLAVVSVTPLPLHPFLPAQSFEAVAHPPLPLQALMPLHLTLASLVLSSPWPPRGSVASKSPTTVIAITFPFVVISVLLLGPRGLSVRLGYTRFVSHGMQSADCLASPGPLGRPT